MECNVSIVLLYTKMPHPPKITNETKSDNYILYTCDRQHKNVPVTLARQSFSKFRICHILKPFYHFRVIEGAIC